MEDETRKPRGRADYEVLLAEHEGSGLTLRAFAESAGVKAATLYAWKRKLRPGQVKRRTQGAHLVPLRVVGGAEEREATEPHFKLALGHARVLSIPMQFDAGELRRLLAVLEA